MMSRIAPRTGKHPQRRVANEVPAPRRSARLCFRLRADAATVGRSPPGSDCAGRSRLSWERIAAGASIMGYTTQGIRNIALVGQAGSGKTLLTEALLLQAGAIRAKGSLQRGTTVSDHDPQEKRLQHSLDPAICSFDLGEAHINLIDTPGYPDFLGRTFSVVEAVESVAVVMNAASGIDSVTQRLMDLARERELCRLIIINKIDTKDADAEALLAELRRTFGSECLALNLPADGGASVVDCF